MKAVWRAPHLPKWVPTLCILEGQLVLPSSLLVNSRSFCKVGKAEQGTPGIPRTKWRQRALLTCSPSALHGILWLAKNPELSTQCQLWILYLLCVVGVLRGCLWVLSWPHCLPCQLRPYFSTSLRGKTWVIYTYRLHIFTSALFCNLLCYRLDCAPTKFMFKPQSPMWLFGYRAFNEVIKIIRAQPQSYRMGDFIRRDTRDLCTNRGKTVWAHSQKVTVYKPGREVSPGTTCDGTLTLDLRPPELRENKCLFKPSVCAVLLGSLSRQRHTPICLPSPLLRSPPPCASWCGLTLRVP